MSRKKQKGPDCRVECQGSDIIKEIPKACQDETAAVEFFELRRWGDTPCCPRCGDTDVYKMTDRDGTRNKRFLWRCRGCAEQYTVRIGAVYEESRLPMRHWAYCVWRMATSKKGVSALEVKRQCQISYKAALFLLNRLRFAMAPDQATMPPLSGIVEVDETFVGGKPRNNVYSIGKRKVRTKTPVFVAVQREGGIRRSVVARVTAKNLKEEMLQVIHPTAHLMSDENPSYQKIGKEFASHQTVEHGAMEYVRGNVHTNTVESSHAIVKRGIMGIYHNVSREYLHRYLWQFDFVWNHRQLNDGQRVAKLVAATDGKRLMYEDALPRMIDRRE